MDGKRREDGVRSFLASRGIELPEGNPDDPPGAETVHGLGNRKNELFLKTLREDGVEVFEGSRRYLEAVAEAGLGTAVVSSSANTRDVLEVTGLDRFVQQRVDGVTMREEHMPGKPAPDSFLRAAQLLEVAPARGGGFRGRHRRRRGRSRGKFRVGGRRGPGRSVRCVAAQRGRHRRHRPRRAAGCAMITDDAFPVEPWHVRETRLELDLLAQSESLFALSNGHIGLRGNLDEGEPYGLPGTYLGSFYEIRPLPYAEAGYGYPEAGQTLVDITNGKILRLLVDDEPFDVRYGEVLEHERVLDMRAGTLIRRAKWRSPAGKQVKVVSTRLVSLAHRSVAAIEYVVEALDEFVRVTVQSELVTNEDQPRISADPRVAAALSTRSRPSTMSSASGERFSCTGPRRASS